MATVPDIRARKGGVPIVMVTAYDAPTARMADAAGVDVILVGDSVGMVVLGYENTLSVTMADMVHHVGAVGRARPSALVVADMPWLSYHLSRAKTVANAGRLIRAGAQAVKIEGGAKRVATVEALVDAEIPVVGHLGITPQSVNAMGGYKVQGRTEAGGAEIVAGARALAGAGCFALVLEGVPADLAAQVTTALDIPTIGIGAGASCDGQVLVFHDLVGIRAAGEPDPRFVRRYAAVEADSVAAVRAFADDVRHWRFPSDQETYQAASKVRRLDAHTESATG